MPGQSAFGGGSPYVQDLNTTRIGGAVDDDGAVTFARRPQATLHACQYDLARREQDADLVTP